MFRWGRGGEGRGGEGRGGEGGIRIRSFSRLWYPGVILMWWVFLSGLSSGVRTEVRKQWREPKS